MKERLKNIKETLMCLVEAQMYDLEEVDAHELGEVIDMIKDLEEADYYCSIVHAMEEASEENYFENPRMYYRDMVPGKYPVEKHHESQHTNDEPYTEKEYANTFQDPREGRSHRSRRMYMESKETHQEKSVQMRELEKYMQELAQDVIEMVDDATPEEKLYLSKKIQALATKLNSLNG